MRDLRAMRTTPVTAVELRRARALLLREIPLFKSSLDQIAAGLIERARMHLPLDEPTIAAYRYLKLTAADVRTAYARWLNSGALVQVTEGPTPH